ncbi:hypothetical protein AGMMS49975_09190 [Clostridia bacterium]|nr:hypothetical protein AGMMS49975_09190 [Clostridia bacterium]
MKKYNLTKILAAITVTSIFYSPFTVFAAATRVIPAADDRATQIKQTGENQVEIQPLTTPTPIIVPQIPTTWQSRDTFITIGFYMSGENNPDKASILSVSAKAGANGVYEDITYSHKIPISDNSTIYVKITDTNNKVSNLSFYVECYDKTAPTVQADFENNVLQISADDGHSGVSAVFVNGFEFADVVNGYLYLGFDKLKNIDNITAEKEINIFATDNSGNKSEVVSVPNPLYIETSEEQLTFDDLTHSDLLKSIMDIFEVQNKKIQSVQVQPQQIYTPQTTSQSVSIPTQQRTESYTYSSTPAGGGTITEVAFKTQTEREFVTVETVGGEVFYLVIDKEKGGDTGNVYLLSQPSVSELISFATADAEAEQKKIGATKEVAIPTPPPAPPAEEKPAEKEPEPEPEPEPTPEPVKKKSGNGFLYIIVGIAALGAGYYFKIYKPKQEAAINAADDEDGNEYGEDDDFSEKSDDDYE